MGRRDEFGGGCRMRGDEIRLPRLNPPLFFCEAERSMMPRTLSVFIFLALVMLSALSDLPGRRLLLRY